MRRRLACAGLGLALALFLTAADAQPMPPTVRQYARQFHQMRVLLDRISRRGNPTQSELRGVECKLRALDHVLLGDGRLLRPDGSVLGRRLLGGDRTELAAVTNEIDALDENFRIVAFAPASPGQLKKLDAVLRDSRFKANPMDRVRQWLNDQILTLLARILSTATSNPGVSSVLAVCFLLAVAGAAFWTAQGALRSGVPPPPADDFEETPVTSRAAHEQSRAAAIAGDYRSALRALFLGTLLELQERGDLTLAPGMTNREFVQHMHQAALGRPSVTGPLLELVDAFDRAWYGHIPVTESAYRAYQAIARDVLTQANHEYAA